MWDHSGDVVKQKGSEDDEQEKAHDATAKKEGESPSSNSKHSSPDEADSRLWVDKYSPKSFTQLLSDEAINREVRNSSENYISLPPLSSFL